jgi:hypothetical protein
MYKSRTSSTRDPSGGVLTRPIAGLGKYAPGVHDCEVVAVSATAAGRHTLLLTNSAGHVHTEDLAAAPPVWCRTGAQVTARVVVGPGAVLVRDVGRYQAQDSQTRAELTAWLASPADVLAALTASGTALATTYLGEVTHRDTRFVPVLWTDSTRSAGVAGTAPVVGADQRHVGGPERSTDGD